MISNIIHGLLRGIILFMLAHRVAGTYHTPWGVTFEITYDANGKYHKYCESYDIPYQEVIHTVEDYKLSAKYDAWEPNIGAIAFSDAFGIEW